MPTTDKHDTAPESIESLGEFGLIDRLTRGLGPTQPTTVLGVGDDCAILSATEGMQKVVTTDLLLEGIHFDLTYCPLRHLGYKAVAVNLSDVCAMNAWPRQLTVSLGLSAKLGLRAVEELYAGMRLCAERHGADIVGGDTTSSLTGLTISITAVGEREPAKLTRRSGARPGDLLCVTGDLGGAYAGLLLLEREKRALANAGSDAQPDLQEHHYVLERQLKPEPRTDVVQFLDQIGVVPTAMMDVSDGLSSECLHICQRSGVGCRLHEEKIPVAPETKRLLDEMNINPTVAALNGGEDYELLMSIDPKDYMRFQSQPGPAIYAVGYVVAADRGCALITTAGQEATLRAQGWRAFESNAK